VKVTGDDKMAIVKAYNDGVSIGEILTKYNIARSTLYKLLQEIAQKAGRKVGRRKKEVKDEEH
jgi:hypothetical protein